MASGLAVSDVINVTVNLSPTATPQRNFGALLILGSTDVIDTSERKRQYANITGVAADFGTTAPEYLAANLFFSQAPQPALLYVGRWAQSATSGRLKGGVLTTAQQAMSNFTAITNGGMVISVDGSNQTVSALNLSSATNLNGVASLLQAKLTGATVVWDANNNRFVVQSTTTGTSSAIGYATAPGSGTDVSSLFKLTSATASAPVNGIAAESLASAVNTFADISRDWYGLQVATSSAPNDSSYLAAAAAVEALGTSHIFGITITSTTVLDPTSTTDLAYLLKAANYKRTFTQYSSSSPYAAASMFGRAFTVNFEANKTAITLKFKQEPGVTAETLTETQAATLAAKNCNVFVNYANGAAIIQQGTMVNGYFFDEVHGTDWLQDRIQNDCFNLVLQSATKIPQTDEGNHLFVTTIEASCQQGVNNGLLAPGVWNADGFGQLQRGQTLTKGYYVYAPLVASQSQADREARKSVPFQVAAKLAGAVHSANIIVNVNR